MFNKFRKGFILVVGIATGGFFQSVNADWSVNAGGISAADTQDVVISLKSNPMTNPEAACLAVTFARSLSANPNSNITLFVTLDGVSLADADTILTNPHFRCDTPWGKISLRRSLATFLDGNPNNMVVCPICWMSRYGDELPDFGVLPGADGVPGTAIGALMFNADKILDF